MPPLSKCQSQAFTWNKTTRLISQQILFLVLSPLQSVVQNPGDFDEVFSPHELTRDNFVIVTETLFAALPLQTLIEMLQVSFRFYCMFQKCWWLTFMYSTMRGGKDKTKPWKPKAVFSGIILWFHMHLGVSPTFNTDNQECFFSDF